MHNRRQDRIIVKALLMSAGFLAIPSGVVAADVVEAPVKDRLTVQQEVKTRPEESASAADLKAEVLSESSESLLESEEVSETALTTSEEESSETNDASEEEFSETSSDTQTSPDAQESLEEATEEESASKSSYRPVSEQLEERKDSSSLAEAASMETSPSSEAEPQDKTDAVPQMGLYSLRSADVSNGREAPANVVSAGQRKDGFFYDETGALIRDRWVEYQGEYYFPNAKGQLYTNRFITFGPNVAYYMDETGMQYRGVLKKNDKLYLFDEITACLHKDNAWVHQSTGDYFPNADGELYHDRFINFGSDVVYYMDSDGAKASGVVRDGGNLYLMDEEHGDSRMRKDNAWVTYRGKQYFPNAQGKLYHDQFIFFGSEIAYYMDGNGAKAHGVIRHGGDLYLLDEEHGDGRLRKDNAWVTYRGKQYFPNAQGKLYHDRPIFFGSKLSYYLGSDGTPQSGIHQWNGKTYFYDPVLHNQSHTTPGVIRWDGKEYTVGSDGAIVTKEAAASDPVKTPRLYSLRDLQYLGVIRWGGYKFTYYSQSVLPGGGLRIPGRHVNEAGYVSDKDGYIVLANSAPNGTVIPTPFGYYGKVYDSGTYGNHFDVYTV